MTSRSSLPMRALGFLVAMQLFCLMLTIAIDVGEPGKNDIPSRARRWRSG